MVLLSNITTDKQLNAINENEQGECDDKGSVFYVEKDKKQGTPAKKVIRNSSMTKLNSVGGAPEHQATPRVRLNTTAVMTEYDNKLKDISKQYHSLNSPTKRRSGSSESELVKRTPSNVSDKSRLSMKRQTSGDVRSRKSFRDSLRRIP
eukprot:Pgem_evm1s14430